MTKIICELGINHNGSLKTALRMIDAAAESGADGVKAQSYRVDDFCADDNPMYDLFLECEIWPHLQQLADHTHKKGLLFGTTPTSIEGVQEAADVGCDFLKNGSDFFLRSDMIRAMVDTGLPTWVSTGMATEDEITALVDEFGFGVKLMACTSLYPCPDDRAGLRRVFDWAVGYSDHTRGTVAAVAAATFGAEMVEKHFTLNRNMAGPDHWFSADPWEMRRLVHDVRRVERMLPHPGLGADELENRRLWRVGRDGALRTG